MQKKLARWADNDPSHRFFDIYHLLYDEDWLYRAFGEVKSNSGAGTPGIDGQTISDFEENLKANIQELQGTLRNETFDPKPVKRAYIPKGDGRMRPLGIPIVKDRIVQEASRMVLEPIYETDFSQYSFGFRPNRSTMDAMQVVKLFITEHKKYFWVIDADIKGFFDNVDHQTLEQIVQDRIKDKQIRDLIWGFLKSGIMEEGEYRHSMLGTPQGGIVSPLLANVYLNELDQWMKQWTDFTRNESSKRRKEGKANWGYIRYADDFLVPSNGEKSQVKEMVERLRDYLGNELDLTLSKKKTELVHVNDGFDFLGFHVERSRNGKGEMQTQITIPDEAIEDFREKIYAAFSDSQHEMAKRAKILALNPVIRGWGNYYRHCWNAASVFNSIDTFIWEQMAHWIAGKHQTSVASVVKKNEGYEFDIEGASRAELGNIETKQYRDRFKKDHPYLEDEPVKRESFPKEKPWLGDERNRAGFKDQRYKALKRDNWTCQDCGTNLSKENAEVHHLKRVTDFNNPEEANKMSNLVSLCGMCHKVR